MSNEFIIVNNVSKGFAGGGQALKNVSMTINHGEIRCLVGENGSGKSTLIKVISGGYKPDEGEIIIHDRTYKRLHPIKAIRQGIQIIYSFSEIYLHKAAGSILSKAYYSTLSKDATENAVQVYL